MELAGDPEQLKERLRTALASRKRVPIEQGAVQAAVLLPLFIKDGEFHLLFTKRTPHLTHHSGEISFPGGVREPGDRDSAATALREAWEEVGIAPEDVEVLGELDDTLSIHNYRVTPVVGVFPEGYQLTVNDDEIERLIEVPLTFFYNTDVYRIERWEREGRTIPVHFYTHGRDEIWGLTGRIMKQFLDVLNGTEPP
ncbi:CoA pyrophosphatase, partial [Geomonas sp.]|uniref:NUDIX hydrolase n=1 Tax=Geomonas sp. TaxID=2651584 RepID=UPI002B481323